MVDNRFKITHYSEEPNIAAFVPRKHAARPDEEARVWAIDNAHAPLYFFPRNCPRAAFWKLPTTTPEDARELMAGTDAKIVCAMEWAWLSRLQNTVLYEYEFSPDAFVPLNAPGSPEYHGVYVARETVTPLAVLPVGDLRARFADRPDVELRLTPSLWPLHDRLLSSSLHYSFIRFAHALPAQKEPSVL